MSEEFSVKTCLSEGVQGVRDSLKIPGEGIVPAEFKEHIKTSRKEFLLAWRSLFDSAISKLDAKGSTTRKATKIKAE